MYILDRGLRPSYDFPPFLKLSFWEYNWQVPLVKFQQNFFLLGERGGQSGLIGEFLVKNGDFFSFSSLFSNFGLHIQFQGLKTMYSNDVKDFQVFLAANM